MSGRLVGAVLQDRLEDAPPRARQGLRTVLIVLAEAAREDGGRPLAWPSVATIADRALLSERQVARLLSQLQELGRIRAAGSRSGGRARTTRWEVLARSHDAGKGDTTSPFEPPERVTPEPEKGDTQMSPEPYEPSSPFPPPSGGLKIEEGRTPAIATPSLPGLGRGEEGLPTIGSRRGRGANPRARGSNPRAVARQEAEERRRGDLERLEAEQLARRRQLEDEQAAARSPEALAARDAVRARWLGQRTASGGSP